ncbi:MAG: DegV family protein [Atopobiaceae bacterium]|nr:DegV family protein [Atopobiaceae bacterium]
MNSQKIALLTDTGTNTPASFIAEHDIRVAPLRISYSDGSTFDSGVNITAAQLVERLPVEVPKTSLPSPQTIRDLFEQAKADGYERAVFVTLSSGLSATCQTVRLVASQMQGFPVIVVDSLSIGIAAGMVVVAAAEMIEADVPFRSLQRKLDDLSRNTWVFFSTKTLEYLRKGGRISEPVYRLGSMLNIKPVITCNESGHYVVARKARGWERSLETEVRLAQEKAQGFSKVRLAICCSDADDYFEYLEERLRAVMAEQGVQIESVLRSDVSPDLLVHTGPDVVGIGVQGIG